MRVYKFIGRDEFSWGKWRYGKDGGWREGGGTIYLVNMISLR